MKKIAVGIAVVLSFTLLQPVSAKALSPSIVIIDNAIDSTLPEFSGKLIHEVCPASVGLCPNGFEGKNAATLPKSVIYATKDGSHGTQMALIALKSNPDAQIIFIRVGSVSANKIRENISPATVGQALEWVVKNKNKYNIVSVSSSLSSTNSKDKVCPVTTSVHKDIVSHTNTLVSNNIGVFYPTGNDSNRAKIVFPACITQAISVGAINRFSVDDGWTTSPFTNHIAELDFYALGSFQTSLGDTGIKGSTSAATAALSAYWAKNYKGSYSATYDYLKSITSTSLKKFVNILG